MLPTGVMVGAMTLLLLLSTLINDNIFFNVSMVNADDTTTSSNIDYDAFMEVIRNKGNFNIAANLFDSMDMESLLPSDQTACTLLVPEDSDAMKELMAENTFETLMPTLSYHILTQRLTFMDLQRIPTGQTVETLLRTFTVLVTNNPTDNLTFIDDVLVLYPNLFLGSNIAVHGMNGVMNFSLFGHPLLPEFSCNVDRCSHVRGHGVSKFISTSFALPVVISAMALIFITGLMDQL